MQHFAHISDAKPSLWRWQQVLVTALDQSPGLGIGDYSQSQLDKTAKSIVSKIFLKSA
jgi:hypothetical protein